MDINRVQCPIPRHCLASECRAEINYEDGTFETITYCWDTTFPTQLEKTWTGRTIFTIESTNNSSRAYLTSAGRRDLRNSVRQTHHVLQLEHTLVNQAAHDQPDLQNIPRQRAKRPKVDILETFAGTANITWRCPKYHLTAAHPMDYNTGWDLSKPAHQLQVEQALDELTPFILIQGIDCKDWCLLQDNTNYVRRKILLLMRRAKARKMLKAVCKWCHRQAAAGRYFLLENPLTSRIWNEKDIQDLLKLPNVEFAACHAGAYGATNSKGQMIKKGHRFLGNCPMVLRRLTRRLSPEQLKQCVPLEGKETTLSQVYPPRLVDQILQGVRDQLTAQYPDRSTPPGKTYNVYMNTAAPAWSEALDMAESTFQVTRYKSFILPVSDPLFAKVSRLCEWNHMERVQISKQPITWRFPSHIPHTHRAAALRYNDGTIEVIEEDLQLLRHPKARRLAKPTEEITFPADLKIPAEVKTAVRRLHKNLGHPHATELKKMLAMNGVKNSTIYTAVDSMRCNACDRARGPNKPDPGGGIDDFGSSQFGDRLQMDIVYLPDIQSTNFLVLGIICETTHLHVATLLADRTPEEVTRKFQTAWSRNFGYPLRIRTDADGSFRSTFEDHMDEQGHGLITGQTRSQTQMQADALRVEAQQHLAAMSIDGSLRRALLRNTKPSAADIPEIGSIVAYWRWTARSGKKRGGYKLARLLGQDPDGKSYWLQAGTNTVRVAPHQLRTAKGFEAWEPDRTQIQMLRIADQNLKDGLLQDDSIPEPSR
ncbi:Pentatricopeptide repeat-containing protein [Durusdinium trenchii]|uniref:Mitochondrial n=1 Tax=Durusdinium trenchii TaxID=1381693 RepID=A0ABP0QBL0_9DINO